MKTASLTERKIKRNSRNMKARLLRQTENQGAGQDPAGWIEIGAITQSYQQSVSPFCHQQRCHARGVIWIQERCTISLHDLFFDDPFFAECYAKRDSRQSRASGSGW